MFVCAVQQTVGTIAVLSDYKPTFCGFDSDRKVAVTLWQ